MTCGASKYPEKDFKGNTFKTNCYKCGCEMTIVKGQLKLEDIWEDTWIPDIQYWTYIALNGADDIKVEVVPPKGNWC